MTTSQRQPPRLPVFAHPDDQPIQLHPAVPTAGADVVSVDRQGRRRDQPIQRFPVHQQHINPPGMTRIGPQPQRPRPQRRRQRRPVPFHIGHRLPRPDLHLQFHPRGHPMNPADPRRQIRVDHQLTGPARRRPPSPQPSHRQDFQQAPPQPGDRRDQHPDQQQQHLRPGLPE